MAAASHFLALLALIMMPLSMAVSPARAHAVTDAAAAGHCDEQGEAPGSKAADCVVICAALAALGGHGGGFPPLAHLPRLIGLAEPIIGIVPEIATPPPKSS